MRHPCLPLWPEKFFADTADMTGDAAAHYLVLLAHAWVRGGSLPNDPDRIRLMLRLSKERWARLRRQILPRFTVGADGRLHQKRMDHEWSRREEHAAKARAKNGLGLDEKMYFTKAKKRGVSTRAHAPDPSPIRKTLCLTAERVFL